MIRADFFSAFTFGARICILMNNKEVFVKHEQAPTAPKLEGVCVFL